MIKIKIPKKKIPTSFKGTIHQIFIRFGFSAGEAHFAEENDYDPNNMSPSGRGHQIRTLLQNRARKVMMMVEASGQPWKTIVEEVAEANKLTTELKDAEYNLFVGES